jgi:galactokinase
MAEGTVKDYDASSLESLARSAAEKFEARFGQTPRLFQAPGRINIIGEHTDYSDGLVLPAAIDRRCVVAARQRTDRRLRIYAADRDEAVDLDIEALKPQKSWSDYLAGVAVVLGAEGLPVAGADLLVTSAVPEGAGVSSSAALEVAAAHALLGLIGQTVPGPRLAQWAQRAENEFVGVPCGVMDQFASANGVAGSALFLDCRTLEARPAPLPGDARFLLVDSMVRHALVDGAYADRRGELEAAARVLGVKTLREAEDFAPERIAALPEPLGRRARHVLSENARVRAAVDAMAANDLEALGALMSKAHVSMRDDLEASAPEVDALQTIAAATPGVLGARIMGGGFGGSVIILVRAKNADGVMAAVKDAYGAKLGRAPTGFVCEAVAGAGEMAA